MALTEVPAARKLIPLRLWRGIRTAVRRLVPAKIEELLRTTLSRTVPSRAKRLFTTTRVAVLHRSRFVNVYHCCVQRTGSQLIKAILSDVRTTRYSGLSPYYSESELLGSCDRQAVAGRNPNIRFPKQAIVTPLYVDFRRFADIPKPEAHRTFFVMRDPRDIVVSWYFAVKYSHGPIGTVPESRKVLGSLSLTDGLLHSIDCLHSKGVFEALGSWVDAPKRDEKVRVFRFEDMIAPNNQKVFRDLFSHCDIRMPDGILLRMLRDFSFERLSGRKQGKENVHSHYRKGVPGDWRGRFDSDVTRRFKEVAGGLVERLGYEDHHDWGPE